MATLQLPPLPQPGLSVIPGFTAQKSEAFVMKQAKLFSLKDIQIVSFASPIGGPGAEFLHVKSQSSKLVSFQTLSGAEVLRIEKKKHNFTGKGSEYHGFRADGSEAFYLKLNRGWKATGYELTVYPTHSQRLELEVRNKVLGQDKGILMGGVPVATVSRSEEWGHLRREDVIYVAPGMDILLALAVNWIRCDKQNEDAKMAASAAS